ncbi:MAG: sigma-70 family RNA polymerase sigma factor [Pirellulales bacterium]|nr:sigma-70 family RNA polymerase sigma factor [Pirellulales bacterium]
MNDSGETQRLLDRAAAGDTACQAALLERYRRRLRAMVAMRLDRRVAARVDASDIVQEVLQKAHARLPAYFADPKISFYPWLRGLAFDRLVDMYRTHLAAAKRSVLKEERPALPLNDDSVSELACSIAANEADPARQAMRAEMEHRVYAALAKLKPQDSEILAMRYLEELSVKEIAEIVGKSPSAVTAQHLRALQRLRQYLDDPSAE